MYLPLVSLSPLLPTSDACGQSTVAQQVAFLFTSDTLQRRQHPHCDNRLVQAAQHRAEDMVAKNYFSHFDPDGHSSNWWARQYGCDLPGEYADDANYIESIGLNYVSASAVWEGWKASPGHRVHVLGEDPFYAGQTSYGFGYAESAWGRVWVVMTAPDDCK